MKHIRISIEKNGEAVPIEGADFYSLNGDSGTEVLFNRIRRMPIGDPDGRGIVDLMDDYDLIDTIVVKEHHAHWLANEFFVPIDLAYS